MRKYPEIWLEPDPISEEDFGRMWHHENVWGSDAWHYVSADKPVSALMEENYLLSKRLQEAEDRANEAVRAANALQIEVDEFRR